MPADKIREFLDSRHVKYVTLIHSKAYTSQEIAALAHVPGREMAKTVVVRVDGKLAMAVLPASNRVDIDQLREVTGAGNVSLATEQEFKGMFPECEPGAMPPFGNLYGMDVFVDPKLTQDREIVFNAGSHVELIRMSYADFARFVNPKVVDFATR